MNPLYRNDRAGEFPPSWYAASTDVPDLRPRLDGDRRADVAILGAGYTGLSAALHLAQKGVDVVVLEAHRAGFGASGRNGGQVGSAFNKDQMWLEAKLGEGPARALWDLTMEAKALTRELVQAHAPDARFRPGILHGDWSQTGAAQAAVYVDWLRDKYDYQHVEALDRDQFHALCPSDVYHGGLIDRDAGHVHPLRYALGLARAAEAAGATIHELTEVTSVALNRLTTPFGTVSADHIILAGNGYMPDLHDGWSEKVMPINSFIAATEPLGDLAETVLTQDIAVADDKFVVNYFRLSEDRRLLFGGRESYSLGFPTDILTALRVRMVRLFPTLKDTRIDYHWGGTLGITMTRLPMVRRLDTTTLAAGGFSGHGVALTGLTGKILAEAVAGQAGRFDLLSTLPVPSFPGGKHARAPLLTLAMTWYALRDRLGL